MNSSEHRRRSSRSGSLVTPDQQGKSSSVPVGNLFSLDDSGESTNYLEATNDSSGTNSICSFDAPPDVSPPIPPRTANPPPRNHRIAANEHLIIIDTDDTTDSVPVPAIRTKPKMPLPPLVTEQPPANNSRMNFDTSFVQNINSLNLQKNYNIDKNISTRDVNNQSKSSEVRRNPSHNIFISNITNFHNFPRF